MCEGISQYTYHCHDDWSTDLKQVNALEAFNSNTPNVKNAGKVIGELPTGPHTVSLSWPIHIRQADHSYTLVMAQQYQHTPCE
jgi:hypothetical protein